MRSDSLSCAGINRLIGVRVEKTTSFVRLHLFYREVFVKELSYDLLGELTPELREEVARYE
jgi:hypothetical protein